MNEQGKSQLSTADMVATEPNGSAEYAATAPSQTDDGAAQNGAAQNGAATAGNPDTSARTEPLLSSSDSEGMRSRWTDIQAQFVDEPRRCVEQADGLVAELMQQLAKMFADERSRLEGQWDRGDEVSTEDLRQALRRYRSFFERLLAI
jgi:hypothetical protein